MKILPKNCASSKEAKWQIFTNIKNLNKNIIFLPKIFIDPVTLSANYKKSANLKWYLSCQCQPKLLKKISVQKISGLSFLMERWILIYWLNLLQERLMG